MPSIVCRSKIRAVSDRCSLSLGVRHHLLAGDSSCSVCRPKETRFPDNVDVLLTSNLVITLSGDLDGEVISAEELYASELAQNIVDYLQLNAEELGLNCVSKLRLDESSGTLKFVLTSSRQYPVDPEILPVHVLLVSIDLCYSWRTPDCSQAKHDRANHPFNERLSLPYKTVLDNVVKRFVTWQLVKRYPLIFGPWRQQLDADSAYFREAASSLLRIIRRSPNKEFRTKCRGLIKIIHGRRIDAQRNAARSLSEYIMCDDEESPMPDITDEDALCYGLERVYRNGMPRPQFKGVASMPSTDCADDEDLACNQDDHSQAPSSMHSHESFLWDEAAKDVLSPTVPLNPVPSGLLDFRSDGEDDFLVDFNHDHQDILEEDEDQNDGDLPTLESLHECKSKRIPVQPELETNPHATALALIREMEYDALSSVLDLDDSDNETNFDSSQGISQYENIDLDGFAFGTVFRLPDGHVVHNESSSDQDSQDKVPHNLGMEDKSQTSSLVPSGSEPVTDWKSDLMEKTHLNECWSQKPMNEDDMDIFPLEEMEFVPQEPLDDADDDDLELGFLSDSTCSNSNRMDITSELVHKLFEDDGDLVGVVARPASSETNFSHQLTTLNVTWPSQAEHKHQMRPSSDGFESSDEDSLWNIEAGEGESESCVRCNEKCFVMELDHLIPYDQC